MVEIICAILGTIGIIVTNILNTKVEMKKLKASESEANDKRTEQINKIEKKLDEHIAQYHRDNIMTFQNCILSHGRGNHSMEEWQEIIESCGYYETFCKENNVPNEKCKQAIAFINYSYQECLKTSDFADVTYFKKEEQK